MLSQLTHVLAVHSDTPARCSEMWLETSTNRSAAAPRARHLRLVDDTDRPGQDRLLEDPWSRWTSRPRKTHSCVLVAGADQSRRAKLRQELSRTLAPGTVFVEISEAWELVQQAPGSRMVMLTGDLHEASAESITRVLGRRYPDLPVLRLDEAPVLDALPDRHVAEQPARV